MPGSRNISVGLQMLYDSAAITKATMVKVIRTDGVKEGYTSFQKAIDYDDDGDSPLTYLPAQVLAPTAIDSSENLDQVDTMEVDGYFSIDGIDVDKYKQELYNGAEVYVFEVNYNDVDADQHVDLFFGYIGKIIRKDNRFTANFGGLGDKLKQTIGISSSSKCRVKELGDAQCKVDLTTFTHGRIITVINRFTITFPDAFDDDYYGNGQLIINGVKRTIKSHTHAGGVATIKFRLPYLFELVNGMESTAIAGCRRRLNEDCIAKFANGLNHHGENGIPGNNKIAKQGQQIAAKKRLPWWET